MHINFAVYYATLSKSWLIALTQSDSRIISHGVGSEFGATSDVWIHLLDSNENCSKMLLLGQENPKIGLIQTRECCVVPSLVIILFLFKIGSLKYQVDGWSVVRQNTLTGNIWRYTSLFFCISIYSYEDDHLIDCASLYRILWDLRDLPKYSSSKWRCVLHSKL